MTTEVSFSCQIPELLFIRADSGRFLVTISEHRFRVVSFASTPLVFGLDLIGISVRVVSAQSPRSPLSQRFSYRT